MPGPAMSKGWAWQNQSSAALDAGTREASLLGPRRQSGLKVGHPTGAEPLLGPQLACSDLAG